MGSQGEYSGLPCVVLMSFLVSNAISLVFTFNFSWSVDLSEDASVLAVGTSVEDPTPTDESIQMYQWNGTRYTALFHGVPGGTVNSVSLSSDGRAVAVGSPYDMWRGGSTRVYNFRPSSPCDDPSEIPLHLSFTTDNNPEETSWELRVDSQVKRVSGSFSGHKYTTYVEEICVPATSCMRFIVYDSRGDGVSQRLNAMDSSFCLSFLLIPLVFKSAAESSRCLCHNAERDGSRTG